MSKFLINTYEKLSFEKRFKIGPCDSPKYEVPDNFKNLKTSLLLFYIHMYVYNRQCQFCYINKTKLKPQSTVQKSEIKIFNWVTLSTIPWVSNILTSSNLHHVVPLSYAKMCSFAHIQNESNLTFHWHVKESPCLHR